MIGDLIARRAYCVEVPEIVVRHVLSVCRPRRLYVCPADMRGEWTFAPILSRQRRQNDFVDSRRNQYWNQNLELSEVVKLYLRVQKMITF